jgi:hypothetical protein
MMSATRLGGEQTISTHGKKKLSSNALLLQEVRDADPM